MSTTLIFLGILNRLTPEKRKEPVIVLVANLDIRVLDTSGNMLNHITLDPTKDPVASKQIPRFGDSLPH